MGSTRNYWDLLGTAGICWGPLGPTREVHRFLLVCTGSCWFIPVHRQLNWSIPSKLVHTGPVWFEASLHTAALRHKRKPSGPCWSLVVHTSPQPSVLVPTGPHRPGGGIPGVAAGTVGQGQRGGGPQAQGLGDGGVEQGQAPAVPGLGGPHGAQLPPQLRSQLRLQLGHTGTRVSHVCAAS